LKLLGLSRKRRSDLFWGYVMVAPSIIGLIILNIYPFFYTLYLSFTESDGFGTPKWIGMENYVRLLEDPAMTRSIINTLYYTVLAVPLSVFLSLIIANLINTKIKGSHFYKAIYFLPTVIAPAAVAMIWSWMFNGEYGIINYILSIFGIDQVSWLTNSKFTLPSLAIVTIWSSLGYNLIILISGLRSISATYYEAAEIDGASGFVQFFKITIPLVSPTLFFVTVTSLMTALKQFDLLYIMVGETSSAMEKSQTMLYLFYKYAYIINEKGYASSIVLVAFAVIMLFTAIQFRLQKKWVHYE